MKNPIFQLCLGLFAALSVTVSYAGVLTKNGVTSSPDFFPIAVWLQSPPNATAYKATGINLYIGLWNGPVQANLDQLTTASMPALCDQNTFALSNLNKYGNVLAGWTQMDEPDNAQANGSGGYDPCISPDTILKRYTRMKSADSTRPVFLNLGQGVSYTNYYGRGTCTNKTNMYPQYLQGCDIACFDIYPVNSIDTPVTGKLWLVAKGVDSLQMWSAYKKPVWAWIECTSINGGAKPTPAQVKAEVWMAIIHGASGFGYFCHQLGPTFIEAALLQDSAMKAGITAINRRVTSLAPILKSPNITGAVSAASGNAAAPVDIMVKSQAGSAYVFAAGMRNDTTTARFSCSISGVKDSVEVLDENRKLAVTNNTFSDHFAAYAVHLYKITLPGNADIVVPRTEKQDGKPSINVWFSQRKNEILISRSMADGFAGTLNCQVLSSSGRNYARFSLAPKASITLPNDKMPAGLYLLIISGAQTKTSKWFFIHQ